MMNNIIDANIKEYKQWKEQVKKLKNGITEYKEDISEINNKIKCSDIKKILTTKDYADLIDNSSCMGKVSLTSGLLPPLVNATYKFLTGQLPVGGNMFDYFFETNSPELNSVGLTISAIGLGTAGVLYIFKKVADKDFEEITRKKPTKDNIQEINEKADYIVKKMNE